MHKPIYRVAVAAVLAVAIAAPAVAAPKKAPERGYYDVSRMAPLTNEKGDPDKGRQLVRTKGQCLSCHMMPIPEDADHGDVGPPLNGVGARLQPAELRLRIADPKILNPDTPMPSFFKKELHRVAKKFEGQTILTAQEVEDVVAYLATLK